MKLNRLRYRKQFFEQLAVPDMRDEIKSSLTFTPHTKRKTYPILRIAFQIFLISFYVYTYSMDIFMFGNLSMDDETLIDRMDILIIILALLLLIMSIGELIYRVSRKLKQNRG